MYRARETPRGLKRRNKDGEETHGARPTRFRFAPVRGQVTAARSPYSARGGDWDEGRNENGEGMLRTEKTARDTRIEKGRFARAMTAGERGRSIGNWRNVTTYATRMNARQARTFTR